ncbi:MAG: hypothetical protein AB1449_03140 [Chloroflexota bacterium]
MATIEQVSQVKETHKRAILGKPNVVGVGVGYKRTGQQATPQLSVVALVRRKLPRAGLAPGDLVPETIGGVATDVVEVGDLRPLQSRSSRFRPAPGGVSIGHYQVTAGTLGCLVRDRASGRRLILSNNHVLASSNNARVGDPILQPGSIDGGREPDDVIGHLERFVPIRFTSEPGRCPLARGIVSLGNALARLLGSHHRLETYWYDPQASNLVDAAVARPVDEASVRDDILEVGTVTRTTPARLGMNVRKSGRSTGFTAGQVTVLDTTVTVGYGPGRTATFEGQIVTTPMSSPGDSGSLLVDGSALLAVGLLFAGSEQATIHCPIQAVFEALGVTFQ